MKLILSEFTEGVRIPVEGSYDAKAIEVEFPDMIYTAPIHLSGEAEKSAGMLRLQGRLTTAVRRVCGKCLKEKNEKLSFEVDWIFDLSGKESVEPLENVRELLIVEHPLVHLCKASCKGLCPQCGTDRNERACNCKENGYHASPVIIKKRNPRRSDIMAHPKRKHSNTRTRLRRAHDHLVPKSHSQCAQCGAFILPHHVCTSCGFYKGKLVRAVKVKTKAKE